MAFQQVEYEFPDPDKPRKDDLEIELEPSSAEVIDPKAKKPAKAEPKEQAEDDYDIEVVDDTPEADRGRKPSDPPEDVTEEELQDYSEKVRRRIQHFSKGYHDERRAKEQALRERQELERIAQQLVEENKRLQGNVTKNQTVLLAQAKRAAAVELESAKRAYRQAYESGEADAVLDAQDKLTTARLKAERLANIKLPALQEKEVPVETQQEAPVNNAPAP